MPDPVVHVWDTGVVLHENALPSFLRPLASAVALAGQDVSLMRRVRALVATTPEAHLAAATGRYSPRSAPRVKTRVCSYQNEKDLPHFHS